MEAGLGSGINLPGRRRARPVGGRASTTVRSSRWAARGRNSVLAASSLLCEGERETSCWLSSRPLVERELLLLFVSVFLKRLFRRGALSCLSFIVAERVVLTSR